MIDTLDNGDKAETPAPRDASDFNGYSMLTDAIARRAAELWAQTGAPEATQARMRSLFVGIATHTGLPEPGRHDR